MDSTSIILCLVLLSLNVKALKRKYYLIFYTLIIILVISFIRKITLPTLVGHHIRNHQSETKRIYDGVEAETRKSHESFQII